MACQNGMNANINLFPKLTKRSPPKERGPSDDLNVLKSHVMF